MRSTTTKSTIARGIRRVLALAAVALLAAAPAASAQTVTATRACVGGAIGCDQVDFTFTLSGGPATVDFFRLALTNAGTFTLAQPGEASDALGPNFFTSAVAGDLRSLRGDFPFGAILDPFVRVRTQFTSGSVSSAGALGFAYALGSGDQTMFSGSVAAVTATPEPSTLLLSASGLLALAGMVHRRRQR